MGLSRQFFVPAGRDTREGGYVRFPLADLLGILALESRRARALVVGEDLGVVPDGLRERMAQNGILRSQVLYFERASPRQYARSALATIGTHDLPPFFGFWSGLDLDLRRRAGNIADDQALARAREERAGMKAHLLWLLRQEGLVPDELSEPSPQSVCVALQLLLAGAASSAVAVALDDLTLEYEPLNVPAASLPDAPNWSRRSRLSLEQIVSNDRIRDLLYSITQRVRGRNPY
jgi:4-alpha-glucanotransferase